MSMPYEMPYRCDLQTTHPRHTHDATFSDGKVERDLWCAGYRERDLSAPLPANELYTEEFYAPTTIVGGYPRYAEYG